MKIIAIEGLDKSGKNTAKGIIYEDLKSKGYSVKTMSFPRYSTPIGKLIWDWLHDNLDVDHHTFELLQAADKQAAQDEIRQYEKDGVDFLIIDRYEFSRKAYGYRYNDDMWVDALGLYIRKPDITIFFDVEPELSMSRKGEHGDNDKYERDIEQLRHASKVYNLLLSGHFPNVHQHQIYKINANQPIQAEMLDLRKLLNEKFK